MAQPNAPVETILGRVEAANDRGVKIAGQWYNVSRYRPVALPLKGATVALTVKGSWIEALEVQDAHSASESPSTPPDARQRTISRLAVLKAAAAFAASRPEARSTDVLTVADLWLRWVEGGERCRRSAEPRGGTLTNLGVLRRETTMSQHPV